MMAPRRPEVSIRQCLYRDLDVVLQIYNHYISRTTISLDLDPQTMVYMQELYNYTLDSKLPFLVVTISNTANNNENIQGFAYAKYFRGLPASVEIFMYLDPGATGRGIGWKLLELLMEMLKPGDPSTKRENGIRQVLVTVPVNEGRDASPFFLKFGFVERGILKGVAWKMGRSIDVKYLQRPLHQESTRSGGIAQTRRISRTGLRTEPRRHWWSPLLGRRHRQVAQDS